MAGMRFWFARNSQVSLHEQLVTQVVFGVVSGELGPGSRLPSTREMARRFRIHPNTVSAGYQQLEAEGWVEMRPGSGVFVREEQPERANRRAHQNLDHLIGSFLQSARKLGVTNAELSDRLEHWLSAQPPDHFLVVEPDQAMREILMAEIAAVVPLKVRGCGLEELRQASWPQSAVAVTVPSKAAEVRAALPTQTELVTLKIRSVPSSLTAWLPLPPQLLVGVASGWPRFLESAQTMLTAAGIDPDNLVLRLTTEADWQHGLTETIAVVCDRLTEPELPSGCRVIPFALVAEDSLSELKRLAALLAAPATT